MRIKFTLLLLFSFCVSGINAGCDSGGDGVGDGDADSDNGGDADGDVDIDADVDADGGADGDGDVDVDGDGDSDGDAGGDGGGDGDADAPEPSSVGDPCRSASDCEYPGASCERRTDPRRPWQDGYCAAECDNSTSAGETCGLGGTCAQIGECEPFDPERPWSRCEALCLRPCTGPGDCRAGYECTDVGSDPGGTYCYPIPTIVGCTNGTPEATLMCETEMAIIDPDCARTSCICSSCPCDLIGCEDDEDCSRRFLSCLLDGSCSSEECDTTESCILADCISGSCPGSC